MALNRMWWHPLTMSVLFGGYEGYWARGGEGGECHIGKGSQLEGIKRGGEKLGVWVQGFLDAQSPGDHWQKRQAHGKLPVADLGRIWF